MKSSVRSVHLSLAVFEVMLHFSALLVRTQVVLITTNYGPLEWICSWTIAHDMCAKIKENLKQNSTVS